MKKIRLFLFCVYISCSLSAVAQSGDSLALKIGQMIMIGFPKAEVDPYVLDEVRSGKIGALIFFEKNIPKTNSTIELKKIIWNYQKLAPIPLLIGIDQEGGQVNRLKEKYSFPRSITHQKAAQDYQLDSIRIYSQAMAATLAGLGFTINFAPVVDLRINPLNPVIAKPQRAFSANADSVILLAEEFIRAHHRFNVLTVVKHFPGHGSSQDDTHMGLADVTQTWLPVELKPYQVLLQEGMVDAVMSSHIVNRQLDPSGLPGTLSPKIIQKKLREEIGFSGVVFSDDMQMKAITQYYSFEEAIKKAILAGIDVLCFSNNITGSNNRTADVVHRVIRKAVESGEISAKRIDESFQRIMKLKRALEQPDYIQHQLYPKVPQVLQSTNPKITTKPTHVAEPEKVGKKTRKHWWQFWRKR